jgi:hypothetical protein
MLDRTPMLSHDRIWGLIDSLAARNGLSVSGLARRAGLDPTTFNKSKRVATDGRLRWPSTESLAKILDATGTNVVEFYLGVGLEWKGQAVRQLPRPAGMASVEPGGGFAEEARAVKDGIGSDESGGWFPAEPGVALFMVAVPRSAVGELYRAGGTLIVSPDAEIGPGDRVLALGTDGDAKVLLVKARDRAELDLTQLDGSGSVRLPVKGAVFLARILWASQ